MMKVCLCTLAGTAACQTCANRPTPDLGTSTWTYFPPNNYEPDDATIERIVRKVLDELEAVKR